MLKGKSTGYKFRRQHSVGNYILDFYCPEIHLAIELDGEVHHTPEAEEYDEARADYLHVTGNITILRFENKSVFNNLEGVLRMIQEAIQAIEAGKRDEVDKNP